MSDTLTVDADGVPVILRLRRSKKARRILLRIDRNARTAELVLPSGISVSEGQKFAQSKALWLRNRIATMPSGLPFEPGASIPFLGVPHDLIHAPDRRAGVVREGGTIQVSGDVEFFARRVQDWLRQEAKREISALAHPKAKAIGRKINRITVRDQQSRWGSCSSEGNLNFSWRLILTPLAVLDYVVAHEVAHLREMNHSARFWSLVDTLTDHTEEGRNWLRVHGPKLHAYGAT